MGESDPPAGGVPTGAPADSTVVQNALAGLKKTGKDTTQWLGQKSTEVMVKSQAELVMKTACTAWGSFASSAVEAVIRMDAKRSATLAQNCSSSRVAKGSYSSGKLVSPNCTSSQVASR